MSNLVLFLSVYQRSPKRFLKLRSINVTVIRVHTGLFAQINMLWSSQEQKHKQ